MLVYAGGIFALSSSAKPLGNIELGLPGLDKLVHAAIFGLLAVLLLRALENWPKTLLWRFALTLLISTLYGISDEWHQSFVPGRDADPLDALADFTGALLSLRVLWWRAQRSAKRTETQDGAEILSR